MRFVNNDDMAFQGEVERLPSRLLEQKGVRKGDNLVIKSVSPVDDNVALASMAK